MVGKSDHRLKVVSIADVRRASHSSLLLQSLLQEKLEASHLAEKWSDKDRELGDRIQELLENGASVEPGPLQATLKTRNQLILHSAKKARG